MIYTKNIFDNEWKQYESVSAFLDFIFNENDGRDWYWRYNLWNPSCDHHSYAGCRNSDIHSDSLVVKPNNTVMEDVIQYCLFNWNHSRVTLEGTTGMSIDGFESFDILTPDEYNKYIEECKEWEDDDSHTIPMGIDYANGKGISYFSWREIEKQRW